MLVESIWCYSYCTTKVKLPTPRKYDLKAVCTDGQKKQTKTEMKLDSIFEKKCIYFTVLTTHSITDAAVTVMAVLVDSFNRRLGPAKLQKHETHGRFGITESDSQHAH